MKYYIKIMMYLCVIYIGIFSAESFAAPSSTPDIIGFGWDGRVAISNDNATTWIPIATDVHYHLGDAVWGNNQYVIVGAQNVVTPYGAIITSPDGIKWTQQKIGTNVPLYGIAYHNNRYVAVGGIILTSSDAITWVPAEGDHYYFALMSVAWGKDKFVAVGSTPDSNKAGIYTSPDGITWTFCNTGITKRLIKIIWANDQFIALGPNNIYTSPDGLQWTIQVSGPANYQLSGIAWNNKDKIVAVTNSGQSCTSPDGKTWTWNQIDVAPNSITWIGNQFIGIDNYAYLLTSIDGVKWYSNRNDDLNHITNIMKVK